MPSITYGTANSPIKNISVNSTVSDQVSQTIMIASFASKNNPQDVKSNTDDFEEVTVVPATITVNMIGNPFITRGQQLYIDFGTNTTLDNIYTVKSVKHSIVAGDFSTSMTLIFGGQGDASNFMDEIVDNIATLKEKFGISSAAIQPLTLS